MSDDELISIAMHDAHGLTPATVEIVKAGNYKAGPGRKHGGWCGSTK